MQPAIDNGGYSLRPEGDWRRRDHFIVWKSPSTGMEVRFQIFLLSRLALEGQLPGTGLDAGEGVLLGRLVPGALAVEEYAPPGREQHRRARSDRRSTRTAERAVGWYQYVAAEFPNEHAAAEICSINALRGRQVLLFVRADGVEGTVAAAYIALDGAIVGRSPLLELDSDAELDAASRDAGIALPEGDEDPLAGGNLLSAPEPGRVPIRSAPGYNPTLPVRFPRPQSRRAWLPWTIGAVAIVLALASAFLQYRTVTLLKSDDSSTHSALGLNTVRDGAQFRLTWNRRLDAIASAGGGKLTILDGPIRKDLDLTSNELQNGSVVYTPVTGDVSVSLEVFDRQRARSVSETVRLLAGPWPETGALGLNSWDTAGASSASVPPLSQGKRRGAADREAEPRRLFRPPAAASGGEPVVVMPPPAAPQAAAAAQPSPVAAALPTPPSETESTPVAAIPEPRVTLQPEALIGAPRAPAIPDPKPQPPAMPPAASAASGPAAPASSSPVAPAAAAPPLASRVEPAILMRRVEPVFPESARNRALAATVVVRALIGKDGRMRNVQAIEGPPVFRLAAQNAVRQWRYRPTLLNGKPVENEIVVQVRFGPQ